MLPDYLSRYNHYSGGVLRTEAKNFVDYFVLRIGITLTKLKFVPVLCA